MNNYKCIFAPPKMYFCSIYIETYMHVEYQSSYRLIKIHLVKDYKFLKTESVLSFHKISANLTLSLFN